MYDVMINSILTYGSPSWSTEVIPRSYGRYNKGNIRAFELLHQRYLRFALGVNRYAPNISLYFLSGRMPVMVFLIKQLC